MPCPSRTVPRECLSCFVLTRYKYIKQDDFLRCICLNAYSGIFDEFKIASEKCICKTCLVKSTCKTSCERFLNSIINTYNYSKEIVSSNSNKRYYNYMFHMRVKKCNFQIVMVPQNLPYPSEVKKRKAEHDV